MNHSPKKKTWAGAFSAFLALFAALVVATPAMALSGATEQTPSSKVSVANQSDGTPYYYSSLADAFSDISTSESSATLDVTMLANSDESVSPELSAGNNTVYFNLNGFNVSTPVGSAGIKFNNGTTTLFGAGTISGGGYNASKSVSGQAILVNGSGAVLNVGGSSPTNQVFTGTISGADTGVYIVEGTVNMNSGTVVSEPSMDDLGNIVGYGIVLGPSANKAELVMNGGSVIGQTNGVGISKSTGTSATAEFTMNGGTVTSTAEYVYPGNNGAAVFNDAPTNTSGAKLDIKDGIVQGAIETKNEGTGGQTVNPDATVLGNISEPGSTDGPQPGSAFEEGFIVQYLDGSTKSPQGFATYQAAQQAIALENARAIILDGEDMLPHNYNEAGPNATRPAAISFEAMSFDGNYDGKAANAAISEALGTTYTSIPVTAENVMWAVIKGTANSLASVQFSYAGNNNLTIPVFNNVAIPTVTDGESSEAPAESKTIDNYVEIGNNGLGVVWFTMQSGGGTSNPSVLDESGYLTSNEPTPAVYKAIAWPTSWYAQVSATSSSEVPVNGVSYWTKKAFVSDNSLIPACPNQYGVAGTEIVLSDAAAYNQGDTDPISSWKSGTSTYPVGTAYELPQPAGYQTVAMVAQMGTPVQLNLKPSDQVLFPTGSGTTFVNAQNEPWKPQPAADATSINIGTDSNGVLPELPGVSGWKGDVYSTTTNNITNAFANKAGAFIGWYSWDNTNGYQLWEAGDVVPADYEGSLQLFPLFAPVNAEWTPATAVTTTADEPYDYKGWIASGLKATYSLSADTDVDAVAKAINVTSLDTSSNAATLFDNMVEQSVAQTPGKGETAPTNSVSNLMHVTSTGDFGLTPSSLAEYAYAGNENDTYDFTVYIPAGVGADGTGGITAELAEFTTNTPSVSLAISPVNVKVSALPTGTGSVQVQPVTEGDQAGMVQIKAIPVDGYVFDHWTLESGELPQGIDAKSATIVVPVGSGTWVANFVPGTSTEGTVNVIRMYNPYTQEHLYTTDPNEAKTLEDVYGWDNENVAWIAPSKSATPIYRLYNPNNGDHLYTVSLNEYNTLDANGWDGEGVKLYSAPTTGAQIYRLYNPYMTANAGAFSHLWTGDFNEYTTLSGLGWQGEGVAFYAVSVPNPS